MNETETYTTAIDQQMTVQVSAAQKCRQAAESDAQRIEKLVYGQMSTGDLDSLGLIDVTVPLFRKYDDAITSSIYYRNPKLSVKKSEGQDENKAILAKVEQRKLEYYVKETSLMNAIALAFAECRTKGTGFVHCQFDDSRGFTIVRHSPFRCTLVDCDADNSPSIEDLMWASRERVFGLDAAKKKWPDHKFKDVHGSPTIPFTETFRIHEDGIEGSAPDMSAEQVTERVKILFVYLRGTDSAEAQDSPQLANSKPIGEAKVAGAAEAEPDEDDSNGKEYGPTWDGDHGVDDEDEGKGEEKREKEPESLYGKAKQVAIYEVCGDGLYLIKKEKLNYVCDDFPIIPLRLTTDPDKFYAYSLLSPFYDIARQAEEMLRVNATGARKHSKTIAVFDEDQWTDEEIDAINNGPDFQGYKKKDILRASNAVAFLDIGKPKEFVVDSAKLFYDLFRDLSNLDALTLGAVADSKERSATGSALLDKRAERLARKMADEFQAFVSRVLRTITQIDRSLMTRERVQKIVGPDIEVTQDVWPNKWSEDDILGEYDVVIKSGSMRYVSDEQRAQEMNSVSDRWNQFIARMPEMLQTLGADATVIIAEKFFTQILRACEFLEIENPEEILPSADKLLTALRAKAEEERKRAEQEAQAQAQAQAQAAMQQQMVPGQPQPQPLPPDGTAVQGPPGDITTQAAVAMAQQILSGQMDPAGAPPEAQMLAAAAIANPGA